MQPNILLIIADGMQADVIDPDHACITPFIEELARRGTHFTQAHTTCPTCSPARASLMTGLLPHNHGVLEVEHGRDDDQSVLRTEHPHFAQRLSAAGYKTAYFGKWHIERSQQLDKFGWQQSVVKSDAHLRNLGKGDQGPAQVEIDPQLRGELNRPDGYRPILHWGVTDTPITQRYPSVTVTDAIEFIRTADDSYPWCCCVSFSEPNEALVVGRETWERYSSVDVAPPPNFDDDLLGRPNLYQRQKQIAKHLTIEHWQHARRCYFGRITEVDAQVGRLVNQLESTGQLEKTVVIFVADHGRYAGAHGFDAHNCGAFEEIYRIPLVIAGPKIQKGVCDSSQVSIADLAPTICDLGKADSLTEAADSKSLSGLLADGEQSAAISQRELTQPKQDSPSPDLDVGYAEYHGTRFGLTQRVLWQWPWKFVFNGFDFDELYHLENDPGEMANLIREPQHAEIVRRLMSLIWKQAAATHDRTILESHYFSMRFATVGPDWSP